jgi:hypothetical protein
MPSHERSARGRDSRRLQNGGWCASPSAVGCISKAEKPAEATAAAVRKVWGEAQQTQVVRWPAQGDRVAAQRERVAVKAQGEEAEKAREKYEAKVDELQASIKALDDATAALDPWCSALDVVSATWIAVRLPSIGS